MAGTMGNDSSERLVTDVLRRLESSFRLDVEVAGRPLRDVLERTVRESLAREELRFGASGPARELASVSGGALSFHYRPHLFPGMEEVLRLGHHVQFHQLPREIPPCSPVLVAAVLESYCHLSGDLFGWRCEPDGRFLLWLFDVSGHGVRAGFAAVILKILLEALDPAQPLTAMAARLEDEFAAICAPDNRPILYATGVFLRLDAAGRGELMSAGHPPVLVSRSAGAIEEHEATGLPLALLSGTERSALPISLHPDDTVLLYTDGLVEATNARGEQLGLGPVSALLADRPSSPSATAAEVYRLLEDHHDLDRLDDDVTFLVLRRAQ
jgi:sigma-B regulation protein RsbU (phosphoserine phosphatase)